MRKGQEEIIRRARKRCMTDEAIRLLSREDLTLDELTIIERYILCFRKTQSETELVTEAERCIQIMHSSNRPNLFLAKVLLGYYTSMDHDTLMGDKIKNKMPKIVQFFLGHPNETRYYALHTYMESLYMQLPAWHVVCLTRHSIQRDSDAVGLLRYNPELRDDFIINNTDSLIYWMMQNCERLPWSKLSISSLYDWETHSFPIAKDKFCKYINTRTGYAINESVSALFFKHSPLHTAVKKFAEAQMNEWNEGCYSTWEMQNKELEQRCLQAYEVIGEVPFEISAYAQGLYLDTNCNMFTNIKKSEYKKVRIDDRKWRTTGYSHTSKLVITPEGRLMEDMNNRLIPLSMKKFCAWYTSECAAGRLMHIIADEFIKQNIFFRDALEDMLAVGCILPVSVDEVMKCHNRKELLYMKYKAAKDIHIKYNKQNLNLSYLIIKAVPYVDGEKNRNILLQQKEIRLLTKDIAQSHRNEKIYRFLINIIQEDIQTRIRSKNKKLRGEYTAELEKNVLTELLPDEKEQFLVEKALEDEGISWEDICGTIRDYVNVCEIRKKKVRLDIYSVKNLLKLHDLAATQHVNYRRATKAVSVPKDSKFNRLRELLPAEFEWIRDRKRLILETELQHHCVWSYADYITNDKAAIYSFTDSNAEHCLDGIPKRYTVEFRLKGNRYYVEQVQGKRDRVNASKMKTYVQEILDSYQNGVST